MGTAASDQSDQSGPALPGRASGPMGGPTGGPTGGPRPRRMPRPSDGRVRRPVRERLIDAAASYTVEHGWATLTMAKLAGQVGVSRQTVYNELGSKPRLAEALVMAELDRFLDVVDRAFRDEPADLVAAIREASRRVLELAAANPLLHAVLSSTHAASADDILPLLTTHSEPLLATAGALIRDHVATYDVPLPPERVEPLVDLVVRLVLSYVMQPGPSPAETADTIAWIAAKALTA